MVKALGRSKTTIFYHVQGIPLSHKLLEKIRIRNNAHLNKIRPDLRGISWLGRHCKGFKTWTPELVKMVGHFAFDGSIAQTSCAYNNRSLALINFVKNNMRPVYEYEPRIYRNKGGVLRLTYNNVEVANFIRAKKEELMFEILNFTKKYQRSFLKAFFDDEGCVRLQDKKRLIKGYQYNNKILFLVQKLLKNFGIESKVDTRFHEIVISRRENIEKFAKEINFSKGIRVNGKRSNSVWKKSLEKRKILAMALASYQR